MPRISGRARRCASIARRTSGARRFADEHRFHFTRDEPRNRHQQKADADRTERVIHRIAGQHRQQHRDERNRETEQCRDILAGHDQQIGLARLAKPAPQALVRMRLANLLERTPQRQRFEHHRHTEHRQRDKRKLQRLAGDQSVDAFINGKRAADKEQQQRDQQRVEIDFAAAAHRMQRAHRLARLAQDE